MIVQNYFISSVVASSLVSSQRNGNDTRDPPNRERGQEGAAALGDHDDEGGWLKLGLLEGNGKGLCRHSRQPR